MVAGGMLQVGTPFSASVNRTGRTQRLAEKTLVPSRSIGGSTDATYGDPCRRIDTVPVTEFETARSICPSPSKSPDATPSPLPVVSTGAWNVPLPLPSQTETVFAESTTARSSFPSPLKSAAIKDTLVWAETGCPVLAVKGSVSVAQ